MLKLFKRLKKYIWMVLGDMLAVGCNVFTMMYLPKYMSSIVDEGVLVGNIEHIVTVGLKMLLISLMGAAAMVASSYLSARASMGFSRDLRRDVFKKAESFSLAEFDRFGAASMLTRTTNDITQLEMVVMMGLRMALMAPMALVGGIIMAFSTSPEMSRVVFFTAPLLLVSVVLISRKSIPLSKSMQTKIDRVNQVMREKLSGIRVMRAFGTEQYEEERFDKANTDLMDISLKMHNLMMLMMPLLMFILNFSTVAILWLGVGQVSAGSLLVGDVMAVVQYVMHIMISFMLLSMMVTMIPRAAASAERINEVLDMVPTITDPQNPICPDRKGTVCFRDVTFAFDDSEEPAISHINFEVGPGQTLAIIGSTGSGKSTILNLIPRFYDATQGQVLVDGVDVRKMNRADLRSRIGYVPQRAVLFQGTIAENLRYGAPNATEEELWLAAEIAQAKEFIEEKEDGLNSEVARGGANFSGGQKQRLSIARAVARRPEIYLFDDSFSALDYKTDATLRRRLAEITSDAAVIIVAQRVSTIMEADCILVLDDEGAIAGKGKHSELLQTCGIYREIVSSQLSAEEAGL
ncbi:MAG: ABC transporter ATP-binding protein [Oscillospiraceae bacterium]|nr:ABC transporter ATP-binding protein [Oscillospiraceae bacterium]